MKKNIFAFLFAHLTFFCFSQELGYEIFGAYQKPISQETLNSAKTIKDINPGYPSSWVSGYISVEVSTTCGGMYKKAVSANDTLSEEQMNLLKMADMGAEVEVTALYDPNNSGKEEDIKKINFTYTIVPKTEASYPGGYEHLKKYLKENAIDKIPASMTEQLGMAIVDFFINEEGEVTEAQISATSGDEEIDRLLLQTIQKMEKWHPAENAAGVKVKQAFEWKVGYMVGC